MQYILYSLLFIMQTYFQNPQIQHWKTENWNLCHCSCTFYTELTKLCKHTGNHSTFKSMYQECQLNDSKTEISVKELLPRANFCPMLLYNTIINRTTDGNVRGRWKLCSNSAFTLVSNGNPEKTTVRLVGTGMEPEFSKMWVFLLLRSHLARWNNTHVKIIKLG